MRQRYMSVAHLYDLLSLEWPVYRLGRRLGVPLLDLHPGDTALDIGCGTGLSFSLLTQAVGDGTVVGVDSSRQMLARAKRRAARGQDAVVLRCVDATRMGHLRRDEAALAGGADALLFTYSLSLMRPWRQAWQQAPALARPGARVVVVALSLPTGPARLLAPLARLACSLGGFDIHAHPWQALEQDCVDVTHQQVWGDHIQIWAGTLSASTTPKT